MPLADEDTGMVDALGKSQLEDLSLQPPLQEVFDFEAQDVIEFHLTLVQHTDPHQTPEQGITWTITLAHLTLTRVRMPTRSTLQLDRGLIDEEFVTPLKSLICEK